MLSNVFFDVMNGLTYYTSNYKWYSSKQANISFQFNNLVCYFWRFCLTIHRNFSISYSLAEVLWKSDQCLHFVSISGGCSGGSGGLLESPSPPPPPTKTINKYPMKTK